MKLGETSEIMTDLVGPLWVAYVRGKLKQAVKETH